MLVHIHEALVIPGRHSPWSVLFTDARPMESLESNRDVSFRCNRTRIGSCHVRQIGAWNTSIGLHKHTFQQLTTVHQ